MINRNKKFYWLNIFVKDILSSKKISLISAIFPIVRIYNLNKIYVGNLQVNLFQPIQKLQKQSPRRVL